MEHRTEVEGAAVLQVGVRRRCCLLLRDGRQRRSRLGRHRGGSGRREGLVVAACRPQPAAAVAGCGVASGAGRGAAGKAAGGGRLLWLGRATVAGCCGSGRAAAGGCARP